jgi:hypothetical protein
MGSESRVRRICAAGNAGDSEELARLANAVKTRHLARCLQFAVSCAEIGLDVFLGYLFSGLRSESEPYTNRTTVIKNCIEILANEALSMRVAEACVSRVSEEFSTLPHSILSELPESIVATLGSGSRRPLELLPKLLELLSAQRKAVVDQICASNWTALDTIVLARCFRDVSLSPKDELPQVVERIIR